MQFAWDPNASALPPQARGDFLAVSMFLTIVFTVIALILLMLKSMVASKLDIEFKEVNLSRAREAFSQFFRLAQQPQGTPDS